MFPYLVSEAIIIKEHFYRNRTDFCSKRSRISDCVVESKAELCYNFYAIFVVIKNTFSGFIYFRLECSCTGSDRMDESKQNPDELLKLIHKEEQQEKEPSKVFFGYTAVLDKTRAMLKAVHAVSDFAPNLNVHTSPDTVSGVPAYRAKKAKRKNGIIFSAADILKCITILIVSSLIGTAFRNLGFDEANIITRYMFLEFLLPLSSQHTRFTV